MSQLLLDLLENQDPMETAEYANSLAIPAALTAQEVERTSAQDPTLQVLCKAFASGDWSCLSGTMYKALSEEIWVLGQLVAQGNGIIPP